MRDGHLNKCKECAMNDVHLDRLNNPEKLAIYEKYINSKPERKKQKANYLKQYRISYPEKYKSRVIVQYMIDSGKMIKLPCEVCGNTQVEAHHSDYSKPTLVTWLCHHHHRELEGRICAAAIARKGLEK